jgi:hypothetical protein
LKSAHRGASGTRKKPRDEDSNIEDNPPERSALQEGPIQRNTSASQISLILQLHFIMLKYSV